MGGIDVGVCVGIGGCTDNTAGVTVVDDDVNYTIGGDVGTCRVCDK